MPTEPSPPASAKPRPRRRWWLRILMALGILLLLLGIFYRPLGHWALLRFGGKALREAGISGTWKTSGTIFTGLSIDELKLSGNDLSPVRSVTMDHAMVDYDLWALRGEGPGSVLRVLEVRNLNAEIDLRLPGNPKPPSAPSAKKPVKLPAVRLPTIRIEHANLRLITKSGDPLVVEDLSLILDPAKPGVIQVTRLVIPKVPEMREVKGITQVTTTTLSIDQLQLMPDTVIEHLLVDVAKLQDAQASVALEGHQAETRVRIDGSSGGWFSTIWADATVNVKNISQDSLSRWGLAPGKVAWRGGEVTLVAKGPVLRPDQLEADLTLADGGFVMPDVDIKGVALKAKLGTGSLTVSQFSAAYGSNVLTATANAAMPDSWAKIARSPGEAVFALKAPALEEMLPPTAAVTGKVNATGSVGFDNMALTKAETKVSAEDLIISGVPVESVQAQANLADQVLRLEQAAVRINAQNTLSAGGQLALTEPKAWSAQWKVDCGDLSSVPAEVKPGTVWPSAGRVTSSGEASGNMLALREKNWAALAANVSLDADGLRIKDAALESLRLRANSSGGTALLEQLALKFDEANQINATGNVALTDEALPAKADLSITLQQTAKLSAWSTAFGGPAIQGGSAEIVWQAEGILKPLRMDGGGTVAVKGLKLDKVPEVLGLRAGINQTGSQVDVTGLTATAGPWKAEGEVRWDGWHLSVPKLEGWVKNERLATLTARIPLAGAVNNGPVPPDSPLALTLRVEQLDTSRLATALGQEWPVGAKVKVDADFKGTLNDLEGGFHLAANDIRSKVKDAPRLEPASVKLDAALSKGKMTLNGTAIQSPLKPLTLTASLPLELLTLMKNPGSANELPLKAEVKLPESSLNFLPSWVPALRSVNGTAAVDLAVTGTVGKPVWKGSTVVRVPEAAFRSPSLPTVKEVLLRVRADEKRVTIDDASVLLAGGRLHMSGGAGLDQPKDPLLDLKLQAEEVLVVRDENLSIRANADITCRGRVSAAEVRGTVGLVRGRVFKEIEFLPLSLPNQLPPPPPSTRLGKSGPPSLPAPLDKWKFDVAIKSRDPIRLMGNVARGNGMVDLRLSGAGAAPVLTGTVKLEEAWLKLPFSRLTITQGVISFSEAQPFDPQIDVSGESLTGGRQVQVVVQGRALDPQVRLTSSPPLPEGEIATLLATGVTTSDLTQNGDEAAGRAAFVLLQQTYRKLFKKRAVDTADDEPPRLSFEFSLFGSDPSRRGVSAVYELNPKWRVIGKVGETGTFRGLLYYLIRFR